MTKLPLLVASVILGLTAAAARGADIPVTGPAQPGLEPFDKLMLDFLRDHHVPGASLAVTRHGRLVYARGFGWADQDAQRPVEPTSLFRLASVSKPVTSAAILRLVELGRLKLTDRAFDLIHIVPPLIQPGQTPDPRLRNITILELLQHRGGFDRDKSLDPMFQSVNFARALAITPPAMPEDIIRVMEGRTLDFAPGERYAYSNFGYCVLGRVIEKVSGESYEAYVQRDILGPLGIRHMQLGHTLEAQRAPDEVHYYTPHPAATSVFPPLAKNTPAPYGTWCIEAMDAHGGWIASAPDIVRFASALDDPVTSHILNTQSVRTLFERPPGAAGLQDNKPGGRLADVWYGCGWQVRNAGRGGINTWHTGLLDGTSTLLVRRWDGLDWAVLFNLDRDPDGKVLADLIDPLVHHAADAVKQWPEGLGRDQAWP